MSDGGPNGYSIISFDGAKYALEFRAARRPADYQMNIYLPSEIERVDAISTAVLVNVFNGSEKSRVRLRVLPDGDWTTMERVDGVDPYFWDLKQLETGPEAPRGVPLPAAATTDHLWRSFLPANLTPGTHLIEVEATDMHGKVHVDRESLRVL
jgi:hypothetical protein